MRRLLKKLKIELPSDKEILLLSEKNENINLKRYMYPIFIAALFILAKTQAT